MKTNQSGSQRQRYKAAMIPVLGVVLVAVVLWPADEPTPAAPAARVAAATRISLASSATAAMAAPRDAAWPPVDLQAITAVNPFARPPAIERLLGKPATPPSPPVAPSKLAASLPAANATPPTGTPAAQRPLTAAVPPPPPVAEVKLQAIVASGGERTALIDSQIVQRGQRLPSGYRVIDITATGIVLEYVAADGNPQPPVTRSLP